MILSLVFLLLFTISKGERNFMIDYENNRFVKDGQPFQYISGSIHYSRVPQYYWKDRLLKIHAAGLNAIEFYIQWNFHEPFEGKFDFSGDANLTHFIDLAAELNLSVILRIGPYICGEWENGGLPWWLLKIADIKMRTADSRFLKAVTKWYAVLLPLLVPYLYRNGGPVILIQIENEYGSFSACDAKYTTSLRDIVRKHVGYKTQLITVDGGAMHYLKCGFIPDVYPTVDFGAGDPRRGFAAQRAYAPRGPLVNSEFYPGRLDKWGRNFSVISTGPVLKTMKEMYKMNASFNFYMFLGGTNFGYWNGAGTKLQVTTTYDFDAPLSEAGDTRPKYFAIRQLISQLRNISLPTPPPNTTKAEYGTVIMNRFGSVFDLIDKLSPEKTRMRSKYPLSMEKLNFPYGFVLYETVIPRNGTQLFGPGVKDRGYVSINQKLVGILIHHFGKMYQKTLTINAKKGDKLQILVENNGRQCSGHNDPKGIVTNVTLDNVTLTNWTSYPLKIENIQFGKFYKNPFRMDYNSGPSIYVGRFKAKKIADTYMDPTGWGKGQFFLNNNNIGRYWPTMGPQVTLYVPKIYIKSDNTVIMFELEETKNQKKSVKFTTKPYLDKPVNLGTPAKSKNTFFGF